MLVRHLTAWTTHYPLETAAKEVISCGCLYMDQRAGVLWNHKFSISNGVGQGGVLSPILFTVYIDDLLSELENEGVGCFWNHHFAGAVCYVDDIALIAPASALRLMLRA